MRGEGQLVDRWMSRRHDVQQQLRFCIVGRASPVSVDASTRRANKVHTVKWAAWGGNSRCNLSHGNIFNAEVHRSEERRVGKSVDLGGRRIIKKKKKQTR